jgi:hypothetical protein
MNLPAPNRAAAKSMLANEPRGVARVNDLSLPAAFFLSAFGKILADSFEKPDHALQRNIQRLRRRLHDRSNRRGQGGWIHR